MSEDLYRSMTTLPVYRLAKPEFGQAQLEQLAATVFPQGGYAVDAAAGGLRLTTATKLIDVNQARGAMWMADTARLWNPDTRPRLLVPKSAERVGHAYLQARGLLPASGNGMELRVARVSTAGTHVANWDIQSGKREDRQLDTHVSYEVQVIVPTPRRNAPMMRVPVLGGEGKIGVTVGDKGEPISANSAWQRADGIETHAKVIPAEAVDRQFREMTGALKIESFERSLAYQAVGVGTERAFLAPVLVYRSATRVGDLLVPLRNIMLPATEFGPAPKKPIPMPKRPPQSVAATLPGVPTDDSEKGGTLSNAYRTLSGYEAGTEWIGQSGGLSGSQANAQGFCNEMAAEGWSVNFNWGDGDVWESDWTTDDDNWVDAADWVFYTGHAGLNGWMLGGGHWLHYSDLGAAPENPGDMYGQNDLEWLIIAACGPLEDDVIVAGGGDVFQRWDGAFDGLHQLLGYGAVTSDNTEEGYRVAHYCRQGDTVINSWFRTGREIQGATNGWGPPYGPTVYVAVMYARRSGYTSPNGDHIWGRGWVAVDPKPVSGFTAMWSPC